MTHLILIIGVLLAGVAQAADPASPASAPVPAAAVAPAPAAAASPPAAPPAKDPEAALTAELVRHLEVGKAIQLSVGERKVLGLYTEQTAGTPHGALLLLHDFDSHADRAGLFAEIRRRLPDHGWTTLSVQLPAPAPGAPAAQRTTFLDQVPARIDAALAHLKSAGVTNVVAVGQGYGAAAALDYGVRRPGSFRALVLLNVPNKVGGDPRLEPGALAGFAQPVLDIYRAQHLDVAAHAELRRQAGRNNPGYIPLTLPGTDHRFAHQEQFLVNRVRGWLDRHVTTANR